MHTGSTQYSPLLVAGVVSVGITAAAILLNAEVEYGEKVFGLVSLPQIKNLKANIDVGSVSEPLIQAALIGLGVAGLLAGKLCHISLAPCLKLYEVFFLSSCWLDHDLQMLAIFHCSCTLQAPHVAHAWTLCNGHLSSG